MLQLLSRHNERCGGVSNIEISAALSNKCANSKSSEPVPKSIETTSLKGFKKLAIELADLVNSQSTEGTFDNVLKKARTGIPSFKRLKKSKLGAFRSEGSKAVKSESTHSSFTRGEPSKILSGKSSKNASQVNQTNVLNHSNNGSIKCSEIITRASNSSLKGCKKSASEESKKSAFDEIVDSFLAETEDWTSERLLDTFYCSFDSYLNVEDFASRVSFLYFFTVTDLNMV